MRSQSLISQAEPGRATRSIVLLLAIVAGYLIGLAVRIYLASTPPINSTDLMRYMGYGHEFWTYGLTIYNYPPKAFVDTPYANIWPDLQFIYPGVSLLFFAGVAALWDNLFFPRLIFSLFDVGNGLLIGKLMGNHWAGLLYFLNPLTIWWSSKEGQYESLIVLCTLLALVELPKQRGWSLVWLALGIQTKYWSGLLLPHFMALERRLNPWLWGVIAFAPSLLFSLFSVYIFHLFGNPAMASNCNPFYWNFFEEGRTCFTPVWHAGIYAISTIGILLVLLIGLWQERTTPVTWWAYLAPLGFVLYYKTISWATPWYLPMFAPFAVALSRRWVAWAILLLILLEPIAWYGLFGTPIGWINPDPPIAYVWGSLGR